MIFGGLFSYWTIPVGSSASQSLEENAHVGGINLNGLTLPWVFIQKSLYCVNHVYLQVQYLGCRYYRKG